MTKKETVLDPGRSGAVCRFEKIETPDKIKDRKKAPCVMGHEACFSLESEFQKGYFRRQLYRQPEYTPGRNDSPGALRLHAR